MPFDQAPSNYAKIFRLINAGALFFVSHSGGKDSQAMYHLVKAIVPANQIVIVHASLGDVEWPGTLQHIKATTKEEVHVVKAAYNFFEMVERRGMWPSAKYRQCTSDLKRSPIEVFIRKTMKERGKTAAVNCVGLRAEESSARAKRLPFKPNADLSKAGRQVYDWLPIFDLKTHEVFDIIRLNGQKPHYAYALGNTRLSCILCILASKHDLRNGALHNPQIAIQYEKLERKVGHTIFTKNGVPITLRDHLSA